MPAEPLGTLPLILDPLIQNAALLLSLAVLYSLFIARLPRERLSTQLLNGLLFGSAAVIGMLYPLTLEPGVIFDGRTAVISMAGLFVGAPATALATIMAGGYRIWLGGAGVSMGLATLLTAASIGLGARALHQRGLLRLNIATLALIGFTVHLAAIAWTLLLPAPLRADVLKAVALPLLCILPTVTMLLGLILKSQEQRIDDEQALRDYRARLQEAQRIAALGDWSWDPRADPRGFPEEIFQLRDLNPATTIAHDADIEKQFTPASRAQLSELLERARATGEAFECDAEIIGPDTNRHWITIRGEAVRDHTGQVVKLRGTVQDSTKRRNAETQLRLSASVFAHSLEGIMITDANNRILDVNPSFTRITGYEKAEVIDHQPTVIASGRHDQAFFADLWEHLNGQGSWHGEIWNQRKNGEVFASVLSISVVFDAVGQVQNYIAILVDNSENKALAAQLEHIAYHDHLTGVPNRRLLTDRLDQAIVRTRRSGRLLAVCYLDLDSFKPINDRHGHEVGDHFLVKVAETLKGLLRSGDTIARLGGDEFVLLLTDLTRPQDCDDLLERILNAIRAPIPMQGVKHSISASIGVTLYPPDVDDPDSLLRHADQAMYLAKDAGKDRYHLYDPEQDRLLHAHRDKLQQITQGLSQDDFVLHFQPQVDMISREVTGLEALIRWQHPEDGLLMPAAFLDEIEGTELETALGEWVINTALRQIEHWRADGLQLPISVNISAGHLLRDDFAARLHQMLDAHPQVATGLLKLEILETAAISDFEQAKRVLTDCRALGVHFALDDFGTGYSSLAYFRTLPIDVLKIDQSFVRDMLHDAGDMDIVESVVNLSHAFKRSVIAEGVETPAHAAMLTWLGCRFGQGYGFARPMPATAVIDWHRQWSAQLGWDTEHGASPPRDLLLMLAIQNCRYWIHHLTNSIKQTPTERLPTDGCESPEDSHLGRFDLWLKAPDRPHCHRLDTLPSVAAQHQQLHRLAADLLGHIRAGNPALAQAGLPELQQTQAALLAEIKRAITTKSDSDQGAI